MKRHSLAMVLLMFVCLLVFCMGCLKTKILSGLVERHAGTEFNIDYAFVFGVMDPESPSGALANFDVWTAIYDSDIGQGKNFPFDILREAGKGADVTLPVGASP